MVSIVEGKQTSEMVNLSVSQQNFIYNMAKKQNCKTSSYKIMFSDSFSGVVLVYCESSGGGSSRPGESRWISESAVMWTRPRFTGRSVDQDHELYLLVGLEPPGGAGGDKGGPDKPCESVSFVTMIHAGSESSSVQRH